MMNTMPMMNMMPPMMNNMMQNMMNGMNMMPMMMPMMPMMMGMRCDMTPTGMTCTMTPMGGMTMETMQECCDRMNDMMKMGMPIMMMCGNMLTMCMSAETKKK